MQLIKQIRKAGGDALERQRNERRFFAPNAVGKERKNKEDSLRA